GVGSGAGIQGTAFGAGTGVLAKNAFGMGPALQVDGSAVFSRSGLATVPAGVTKVKVTGVPLTAASLILATAQQASGGISVTSAVPNVQRGNFVINLSAAPPANLAVAWFVVN